MINMVYTDINIEEIKDWLKENLCEERYIHTLGVMDAAVELAQMFNLDVEKARLAGVLHDAANVFLTKNCWKLFTNIFPRFMIVNC